MKKSVIALFLVSFLAFGLVQCQNNTGINKDVHKQSLDDLQKQVSELQEMFKQAEAEKTNTKTPQSTQAIHTKIWNKFKGISHFLFTQGKFVVDKSDKIISKKAFITAMLILGPALAVYCKFFNPDLLTLDRSTR